MWAQTAIIKAWEESLAASKTFILPASVVSDKIVKQVLSGRSGQVYVPDNGANFSSIRGFPAWLQEHLRDGLDLSTKPR
jgi:all-trans-retinol dehydrogenase (NAD+)